VGDLLETEDGQLRICKYVGFEPAQWVLPEPKHHAEPENVTQPAESASVRRLYARYPPGRRHRRFLRALQARHEPRGGVGDRAAPAKVRCRTCHSDHDYRHEQAPPPKVDARKAALFQEVLKKVNPDAAAVVDDRRRSARCRNRKARLRVWAKPRSTRRRSGGSGRGASRGESRAQAKSQAEGQGQDQEVNGCGMISRRTFLAAAPAAMARPRRGRFPPPQPYGAIPSALRLAWHEMEYTAFLHFTVNTFTDKEWGYGDEDPNIFQPPIRCRRHRPRLKSAGVRGLHSHLQASRRLLPVAHQDHRSFHSRSSWKGGQGDVVRDLSDAARRAGLKFGVYLSPWDRNNPQLRHAALYRNLPPAAHRTADAVRPDLRSLARRRQRRRRLLRRRAREADHRQAHLLRLAEDLGTGAAIAAAGRHLQRRGPRCALGGQRARDCRRPLLGGLRSRGRRWRTGFSRRRARARIAHRHAPRLPLAAGGMRRFHPPRLVLARKRERARQDPGAIDRSLLQIGGPRRESAAECPAQSPGPPAGGGRELAAGLGATCRRRSGRSRRGPR
jgi:hypothetical protein